MVVVVREWRVLVKVAKSVTVATTRECTVLVIVVGEVIVVRTVGAPLAYDPENPTTIDRATIATTPMATMVPSGLPLFGVLELCILRFIGKGTSVIF